MDPLVGAGAFATIVGLLCSFKTERSGSDIQSLLEWLDEKNMEDTSLAIQNNAALSQQLSVILSINHDELVERLDRLDLMMTSIIEQTPEFGELAKVFQTEPSLSEQAISITRQLVNSGAKLFMECKIMTGDPDEYILLEGGHGQIHYTEPQFIEDDLQKLLGLSLLQLEYGSKGSRRFLITRAASRFIREIDR